LLAFVLCPFPSAAFAILFLKCFCRQKPASMIR
jgi:hypothetical protein